MYAHTLNENRTAVNIRSVFMVLCCVILIAVAMVGNSQVAYCTAAADPATGSSDPASAIQTGITQMATQIYTTMRAIITPLTIIAFAFAGFQFLTGGNQGTEKAKKTLMAGGVGLALVIFAPLFGQAIATWFAGSGTGDLGQYNPLA